MSQMTNGNTLSFKFVFLLLCQVGHLVLCLGTTEACFLKCVCVSPIFL